MIQKTQQLQTSNKIEILEPQHDKEFYKQKLEYDNFFFKIWSENKMRVKNYSKQESCKYFFGLGVQALLKSQKLEKSDV